MENGRILRKKTRLFSLGLPAECVVEINEMINTGLILKENFSTLEKNDSILSSDIVFIFAESKSVMEIYEKYHSLLTATPVFVHYQQADAELHQLIFEKYPISQTLSLPMTIESLSSLLMRIVTSKKMSNQRVHSSQENTDIFNILVVDDSFPVRKFMDEKLPLLIAEIDDRVNFDVEFAVSGKQAVSKVKQSRGKYDIIFLDVVMEDINGYKVCKWIKQAKPSINVVMLTSKKSRVDRIKANLSGCDTFLSKPPKDEDLKKVLENNDWFDTVSLNESESQSTLVNEK